MEDLKGKIIKLTKKQMKDLYNVEFVDCNSYKGRIYKYMPLSRVLQLLRDQEIAFVYPELWPDPYETKYLKTDYSAVGYNQNKIFCLCGRMDNANEEASWKIYAKPNEPLIRVTIDSFKLLERLGEYTLQNNCNLYMLKINYKHSKKEIDSICQKDSPLYKEYIEGMDELKYIRLMSLKRLAFSYENERRFFIVPQHDGLIGEDVLKVGVDLDMFTNFEINPCERIKDNSDILSKIQLEQYNSAEKCIKEEIKRIYPEARITTSRLYSNVKPVVRIEA